jgi:hypothetical protein
MLAHSNTLWRWARSMFTWKSSLDHMQWRWTPAAHSILPAVQLSKAARVGDASIESSLQMFQTSPRVRGVHLLTHFLVVPAGSALRAPPRAPSPPILNSSPLPAKVFCLTLVDLSGTYTPARCCKS